MGGAVSDGGRGDESPDGLGYLLAKQLVAAGETVVDVPATLASRTRCWLRGVEKNDPNDALSVAVTALRSQDLRRVATVDHREVLRLLSSGTWTSATSEPGSCRRLHVLLPELPPGGIAKEIKASDVDGFLARSSRATPAEQVRYDLAVEMLDDIRRLDGQLKASHKRIRSGGRASDTTLTELFGVGPVIAAMFIGYTGDVDPVRQP